MVADHVALYEHVSGVSESTTPYRQSSSLMVA